MKFGGKKQETIGIDIGRYSIKVVSLKRTSEKNILSAYNIKKIPIKNRTPNIPALVGETLNELDLHPSFANLSVSGPEVIVRFIELPKMNQDQLKGALVFEAEKYIPFNINDIVLDSLILGDAVDDDGKMNVLLAAVKRKAIDGLVKDMESLGINIGVIDIGTFAMYNAFTSKKQENSDECEAFIDLGYSQTNVLVSLKDTPCFTRQIQIGAQSILENLSKAFSVDIVQAEQMLIKPKEENKEETENAIQTVLDDLIKEMQFSFGYVENRYNKSINSIFASGGLTYQKYVIPYLSEKVGVPLKKWNPTEGIELAEHLSKDDLDLVSSELAVAIGLALRG